MSSYSAAERHEILRQARANVAEGKAAAPANGSSASGLVYKTRNDAVATDDDGRAVSAKSATSEMSWWEWVDARMDARFDTSSEAVGEVVGTMVRQTREALERELRVLKRERVAR